MWGKYIMKITVYGTRGSYPVCTPNVIKYGGNTTCHYIESGDDKIIIDGGSGIRNLGKDIMKRDNDDEYNLNLLITHTHWDHIMGYPFFSPLYNKSYSINIYGAESETMKIPEAFSQQHKSLNHPIPFESLKANINFNEISGDSEIEFENIIVKTYQLNHPGKDMGYRFETKQGVFVLLTDLASIEDNYLAMGMEKQAKYDPKGLEQSYYEGLVNFIKDADVILHDTNFTEEEIKNKRHWGHSSPEEALKLVSNYDNPPSVILSHHDPFHSDSDMDLIYKETKRKGRKSRIEVLIAKEGGEIIL